jgi:hypothetical protein
VDHPQSGTKVNEINNLLYAYQGALGVDIVPSSRPFMKYGLPVDSLYAIDGLHLNACGNQIYREYVGRVLGRLRSIYNIPRGPDQSPPTLVWGKIKN